MKLAKKTRAEIPSAICRRLINSALLLSSSVTIRFPHVRLRLRFIQIFILQFQTCFYNQLTKTYQVNTSELKKTNMLFRSKIKSIVTFDFKLTLDTYTRYSKG